MIKLLMSFVLLATAYGTPIPNNDLKITERVVQLTDTLIEDVPYQVSIQILGSHICGGSIISSEWILTAAHCLTYQSTWYTIRTGSNRWNSGGNAFAPGNIIVHEGYGSTSLGILINDIALIQLRSPLILGSTQSAIELFNSGEEIEEEDDTLVLLSGWGAFTSGASDTTLLRSTFVSLITKHNCNFTYRFWGGLPENQICADVATVLPFSQADEGGPLVIDGRLAGVMTWGANGFPGVYAEVSVYRTWITQNTGV